MHEENTLCTWVDDLLFVLFATLRVLNAVKHLRLCFFFFCLLTCFSCGLQDEPDERQVILCCVVGLNNVKGEQSPFFSVDVPTGDLSTDDHVTVEVNYELEIELETPVAKSPPVKVIEQQQYYCDKHLTLFFLCVR